MPSCSAVTTPAMEVAVMLPGRSRAAAGVARSKDTALGQLAAFKAGSTHKAHVLKSHESVDGKGQETFAALYGGCLAVSPALTFPAAGLNWVSLTKPKCGTVKRCQRTPAGTLRGAEGGRARDGSGLELEPSVTQQRGSSARRGETCPAELCPGRRAGKQVVTGAFKGGWSPCASALQGEGGRKWVLTEQSGVTGASLTLLRARGDT